MVPTMGDPNGRDVLPRAITISVRFRAAKGNLQPAHANRVAQVLDRMRRTHTNCWHKIIEITVIT